MELKMKSQLTTRFDRPAVEERAKKLTEGTDLTMSHINRAALRIGLDAIEVQKITYDKEVFEKYILENQDV